MGRAAIGIFTLFECRGDGWEAFQASTRSQSPQIKTPGLFCLLTFSPANLCYILARTRHALGISSARRMIDGPNYTQRKAGVHVSALIQPFSAHHRICRRVWVLSVCVGLPPSIRWARALLLKGALQWATQPAIRSGEILCPRRLNALQMSL